MEIRFIELFAGIGGFRYGLEKAENRNNPKGENRKGKTRLQPNRNDNRNKGNNANIGRGLQQINNGYFEKANDTVTKRIQQGIRQGSKSNNIIIKPFMGTKQFTCVWANEWEYDPYKKEKQYAWKIYQKNYGTKELDTRNIEDVPAESIPDFDFLTAGFPCQRFSIAGKRKGMSGEDTKGSEFYEVYRIAKVRHPQLLLLENVPGLFSSRSGEDFQTILRSLDEIGYDVEWDCINTSVFLPQNRLRVFIIGHLRGKGRQKVFPIELCDKETNELERGKKKIQCASTLRQRDYKDGYQNLLQINKNVSDAQRVFNPEGLATTLKALGGGQGAKTGLYMNTLTEAIGTRQGSSKEYIQSVKNINEAIGQVRRLTPIECERLQGFPDGWTEGISDTQRYKCLGNAVTTNVITEIGKKIKIKKGG